MRARLRNLAPLLFVLGWVALAGCSRPAAPPKQPTPAARRPSILVSSADPAPSRPSVPLHALPATGSNLTAERCFPLAIDNRWLYQVTDSKGATYYSDYEIERKDKIGGKVFFVSRNTLSNHPDSFSRLYLTHTSIGLSNFRVITTKGRQSAIVEYGKPANLLVNLPPKLAPGKKWDSQVHATIYITGVMKPYRVHGEVGKVEKVTVPAGNFKAIKVATTTVFQGTRSATTAWYVPGLGQVKFVNRTDEWKHVYQLQAVEIGGKRLGRFEKD